MVLRDDNCEKRCEIQDGSQEMAVGKIFNNDNSDEFGAKSMKKATQIT